MPRSGASNSFKHSLLNWLKAWLQIEVRMSSSAQSTSKKFVPGDEDYIEPLKDKDTVAKVAGALGITPSELKGVVWNIDNQYDRNGILSGHNVHFRAGTSRSILSRIGGLADGCWVRIGPLR